MDSLCFMTALFYGPTLVPLMFLITSENDRTTMARGNGHLIPARTLCYGRFVTPSIYLKNIMREVHVSTFDNSKVLQRQRR